jgi:hypothetical protein
MTANNANAASGAITVCEVLRLLWKADHYPILGNHDAREATALTRDALDKASTAVSSPDDPPEFAGWLNTLRKERPPNIRPVAAPGDPAHEPPVTEDVLAVRSGVDFIVRGLEYGDLWFDRIYLDPLHR